MSIPRLIDAHTHAQFAAYDKDRDAVIRRALDAGIWMINVGTQRDTSANSRELAHRYNGVYATVGLHPIHTEKSYHDEKELSGEGGFTSRGEEFNYDYYKKLAQDPKVVAIGECGLDYYRSQGDKKLKFQNQKYTFERQIELAHEIKKPLMIHCRQAFDDLIDILTSKAQLLTSTPGVIHFFSGNLEDARRLMDIGFSFSFGGVITFPPRLAERSRGEAGAREYEKLIKFIPLDRILLETDAPYVTPLPHRGKRNEPLYVEEVAQKIARILNKDFEEIARITTDNAIRIFGLK